MTFVPQVQAATININGGTSGYIAGTSGPSAYAVGYNASNSAYPSSFSTNFLVKGDGTGSSLPITITSVPYASIGGTLYFAFVLDAQETNNNESLQISAMTITVVGAPTPLWTSADMILLNGTAPFTLTALGNGADMALFIPVSIFNGLNSNNQFVFSVTHNLSHNGNEEWMFTNFGIPGGTTFYAPGVTIIAAEPVPEPATWLLSLAGIAGLAALRRRRSS